MRHLPRLAFLALVLAAAVALVSDTPRTPPQPAYCPSPAGLYVPCRDADRIMNREWKV